MLIAHLPANNLNTHRATAANIITMVEAITLKIPLMWLSFFFFNVVVVLLYKTAWELP